MCESVFVHVCVCMYVCVCMCAYVVHVCVCVCMCTVVPINRITIENRRLLENFVTIGIGIF